MSDIEGPIEEYWRGYWRLLKGLLTGLESPMSRDVYQCTRARGPHIHTNRYGQIPLAPFNVRYWRGYWRVLKGLLCMYMCICACVLFVYMCVVYVFTICVLYMCIYLCGRYVYIYVYEVKIYECTHVWSVHVFIRVWCIYYSSVSIFLLFARLQMFLLCIRWLCACETCVCKVHVCQDSNTHLFHIFWQVNS